MPTISIVNLRRSPESKRAGFTLIELLIVMAILGLLMVLGVGNFQTARIKARDAERKSDLATIAKSLEAYVNDHSRYPLSSNGEIVCDTPTVCTWGSAFTDGNGTVYAATLPDDGVDNRSYVYDSSDGNSYSLYASLENLQDPAITSLIPAVACGSEDCNYKITSTNIN